MKILAMEKELPGVSTEQFAPLLESEARAVWKLYLTGSVRELYFDADVSKAVLVLDCGSTDEASTILNSLPLVQSRLIKFDLIPLIPYPGFARLFSNSDP